MKLSPAGWAARDRIWLPPAPLPPRSAVLGVDPDLLLQQLPTPDAALGGAAALERLRTAFGDEQTALLRYDTDTVPVAHAPGAERRWVENAKIIYLTIIFDRLPFAEARTAAGKTGHAYRVRKAARTSRAPRRRAVQFGGLDGSGKAPLASRLGRAS